MRVRVSSVGPAAGWLASSLSAVARVCMTDVVSYEYDKRDDSPARRADVPRARRTRRALPEPLRCHQGRHPQRVAATPGRQAGSRVRCRGRRQPALPLRVRRGSRRAARAPPRPARARHAHVTASPQRGQAYRCDLGYGLKPWLVVSNNARTRLLDDIIAIRLPTTARHLPTWVNPPPARPLPRYPNPHPIQHLTNTQPHDHY